MAVAISHHPQLKQIFFHFWNVLRATGLVVEDIEGSFKSATLRTKIGFVLHICVVVLIGVLLLIRMEHFAKRAPIEERFTYNWCVSFVHMNESVFHFTMFMITIYWVRGGVLREFFDNIATIHSDKFLHEKTLNKLKKRSYFLMVVMCASMLTTATLSCIQSAVVAFNSLPLLDDANSTVINAIPDFGRSMLQTPYLYPIDLIVYMFAVTMSSTVLALFYFMHTTICLEYSLFNKELESALEENTFLEKPEAVNSFCLRQLVLMKVVRAMNNRSEIITSICFLTGTGMNVVTFFIFIAHYKQMSWFQVSLWSAWELTSLLLMTVPFKKISDIHNAIENTKYLLLFDKTLWNSGDAELVSTVNIFIDRISHANTPIYIFDAAEIKLKLLGKVFIVCPLFAEVLLYLQNVK